MTKEYKCVPIQDYYVVVEEKKNYKINKGEYYYHNHYGGYRIASSFGWGNWQIIIATIGKRIDSLPLIEIPDEVEQMAEKITLKAAKEQNFSDREYVIAFTAWYDGYKAATKTYTEEDMRIAFNAGEIFQRDRHRPFVNSKNVNQYLDSLKVKPITAVELELEWSRKMYLSAAVGWTGEAILIPKVDEKNIIHPVNVFYEL